jgi:hypothetical protein
MRGVKNEIDSNVPNGEPFFAKGIIGVLQEYQATEKRKWKKVRRGQTEGSG